LKSTSNALQTAKKFSHSLPDDLKEASALIARNNWPKARDTLGTSAQCCANVTLILKTAHSDLVCTYQDTLPSEWLDDLKLADVLEALDDMIAKLYIAESQIQQAKTAVDQAEIHFPRMAFINGDRQPHRNRQSPAAQSA
ncbi:hypothetical protein FRC07_014085, partial [Ceratobasidium sp. 392]